MLAAGGSRRLGKPKQFVKYRGVSLIERVTRTATAVTRNRTVVVAGDDEHRIRRVVGRRCVVVRNRDWHTGMRSSLEHGLRALPQGVTAALVLTCDQPRIRLTDIRDLVVDWSSNGIRPAAAYYSGRPGVPAVIPRRFWRAALAGAGPDQGAGPWLMGQRNVLLVPMATAEFDVDTPADLAPARFG